MQRLVRLTAAILFSGGDAPGMNALLWAFVRLGLNRHPARVLAIKDGYLGLVRTCQRIETYDLSDEQLRDAMKRYIGTAGLHHRRLDLVEMDHLSVSRLIDQSGIRLGSSRCEEFRQEEVRGQVVKLLDGLGVSALVVVGGDGSLAGAAALARESGLTVIGIPATIDNDYPLSERTLGADTAVTSIRHWVRSVNLTAGSMHRVMVLETMGRDCGHLAQEAGLASGAEIVVTPERQPLDEAKLLGIARRIEDDMLRGRTHAVVLVAEGVKLDPPSTANPSKVLADYLQAYFHREGSQFPATDVRQSILGHVQRGGEPTVADVRLAIDSAEAAWKAIVAAHPKSGVIVYRRGRVELCAFDAPPPAGRDKELERIYQLQKDLSDYGQLQPPAPPPAARKVRRAPRSSTAARRRHSTGAPRKRRKNAR